MKTFAMLSINCDCSSDFIARQKTKWVYGPRCPSCGRILGPMQWSEIGKIRAKNKIEAEQAWAKERKAQSDRGEGN